MSSAFKNFFEVITQSTNQNIFVKLSLGNYTGEVEALKQVFVKPVEIKRLAKLSFTYRYKTKDVVKNYEIEEGIELVKTFFNEGFNIATFFTVDDEFILERNKKGVVSLRNRALAERKEVISTHNKQKQRLILAKDNIYLNQLGLTDEAGVVFKSGQDKYKQINQYIEILSSLIKELPAGTIKKVVDMGSGKGYLTFALYDYLKSYLAEAEVVGVEFRKDMVDLCNIIAAKAKFDKLKFVEGTIDSFDSAGTNLLIALHACDTATDDAIYKGINANAELIVVAPCCHKQIRRAIEKGKAKNDLDFLTKHGIFLERQSEMVTDGLRALILEYFGYKTKVFEFVSGVHTPKNVLVVGIRNNNLENAEKNRQQILDKVKSTKAYFGIDYHHLERLTGL